MANLDAQIVSKFKGIHRPGLTNRISTRRVLDEPREMYNFHITSDGHLFMPQAADEVWDLSALTGESTSSFIRSVHYVETPRGLVVQSSSGRIYHIGIEPPSSTAFYDPFEVKHIATMGTGEEAWPLWVNSTRAGYYLMGYAPRGSSGPDTDGKTWKITGDPDDPTTTDLTATVTPTASYSILYKGRRLWVKRGRTVYYSELDDYDSARPSDNNFRIAGDDAGESYLTNPGFVSGMVTWEDVCIIFLSGSIWMLTGANPATDWTLRQVQSMAGNSTSQTLVRTDEGVLSYGGANLNSPGVYLFTGQNSVSISEAVREWLSSSIGNLWSATYSGDKYIMSVGRSSADGRQFLIYDFQTQQWTAFDGFINGVTTTQASHIVVAAGTKLYRSPKIIFPRLSGRGARIRLGYSDDENPTGLQRFLGLKISGRKWGTGSPTVTVTATTPDGDITTDPITIPTDVFDGLFIPLNIRGAGIEFWMEFTAPSDDNELLIENLQIIRSRKGEKVSRT